MVLVSSLTSSLRNRFAPHRRALFEESLVYLSTLLDVCVSSLRRGRANVLCIVSMLADDPPWIPFRKLYIYIYIYCFSPLRYIYIYIYIYTQEGLCWGVQDPLRCPLHPVSVRRFPSFRTQPLENLSRYL